MRWCHQCWRSWSLPCFSGGLTVVGFWSHWAELPTDRRVFRGLGLRTLNAMPWIERLNALPRDERIFKEFLGSRR